VSTEPVAPPLEVFLARLYADPAALERFLRAPEETVATAGLDGRDAAAMLAADRAGLVMAARSYEKKRNGRRGPAAGRSSEPR
jgi:hypothetical protein